MRSRRKLRGMMVRIKSIKITGFVLGKGG